MSGYELSRFVDLNQSDAEELICRICHDILRNPVFTNCCLQTFCKQCINDWLETNNTCPYDRKQLNRSQLFPSQRKMSGYELKRFVDLSHTDITELTCSICRDVLRDPVVANCCLQTFCKECITIWIKTNNSCPYDRKTLSVNQLTVPPRNMTNMLGKLTIRCKYEDNGCQTILLLDNLSLHENGCDFREKLCDKCFCVLLENHVCVQSLLGANRRLNETIVGLETQLNSTSNIQNPNDIENNNDFGIENVIQNERRFDPCKKKTMLLVKLVLMTSSVIVILIVTLLLLKSN